MDIGIIQITSNFKEQNQRFFDLKEKIIPKLCDITSGKYTLVSPPNESLRQTVESNGGTFIEYSAWDKDKNRKFREGMNLRQEEWVVFLDDDILLSDTWLAEISSFLEDKVPGQYGFRLVDQDGNRHELGEDWMQFVSQKFRLHHRPLEYDIETGFIERSPTSYVSNSVVHRDVYNFVEPYGVFQKAPDVTWCFAIKEAGFPVDFCLGAWAYHLGDRGDNR